MGSVLGLAFGVGIVLIWRSWREPAPARSAARTKRPGRLAAQLEQAGLGGLRPARVVGSCVGAAVLAFGIALVVTRTTPVAVVFAIFAGLAPVGLIRMRARARRRELREHWPDAVDNIASAVRAGLALPDALAQLGRRGPEPLREPFERFGHDYRAGGRFDASLDALKVRLADPTGDRIVESLRIARDVGGNDLGRLLRTLSMFLRDDLRARAELETRQGWVVNAARLAVAAPWLLLVLLSLRSSSVRAFDSPTGWVLLAVGAGLCVVAYQLMVRIGRLPEPERVLR